MESFKALLIQFLLDSVATKTAIDLLNLSDGLTLTGPIIIASNLNVNATPGFLPSPTHIFLFAKERLVYASKLS